jgi:hypothetical protein
VAASTHTAASRFRNECESNLGTIGLLKSSAD